MATTSFVYPPPTDGKPFRLVMGLRQLDPANFLEGGSDLLTQIQERNQIIELKREIVFQALPDFTDPAEQFKELILQNLRQFHSHTYQITGKNLIEHKPSGIKVDLDTDHPFVCLGRIIPEDLCLMSRIENEWVLTAGLVAYPSRWSLQEKIGQGLDQIHQPVPDYQKALQPVMTPTFDKLVWQRPVWRLNWALHSSPQLHQPTAVHMDTDPWDYWWRTERQTLTKLEGQDHILFTIRNRTEPLSLIKQNPEAAKGFGEALASLSPETIAYKGLSKQHQQIVDALCSLKLGN